MASACKWDGLRCNSRLRRPLHVLEVSAISAGAQAVSHCLVCQFCAARIDLPGACLCTLIRQLKDPLQVHLRCQLVSGIVITIITYTLPSMSLLAHDYEENACDEALAHSAAQQALPSVNDMSLIPDRDHEV